MMPPDAIILEKVRQWLTYADEDLRVARHAFSVPGTPPYRVIAFHAQQCAEKYLKAFLVFQGVDFPYTHSLRRLLDLCTATTPRAEQLRDAEELSPYAVTARYPGEDLEVSETEARRAVEIGERVREVIRGALQEEGFEAGPENKPS
jgi:HEPN domain-containing protein